MFPQTQLSQIEVLISRFDKYVFAFYDDRYVIDVLFGDKQVPQEDFIKMMLSGKLSVERLLDAKIEFIGKSVSERRFGDKITWHYRLII